MDPSSCSGNEVEKMEQCGNLEGVGLLETKAETLKKLADCLEPLRENQIQVDSITVSDMQNLGYMSHQMVKHVRVLTMIPYKEVRDSVFLKANSLGLCPLNHEMIKLPHIVEVCSWMKTESGIEALVEVQRIEKLKRRAAAKERTLAEMFMIRAMNEQFAEYNDEIKKSGLVLLHGEEFCAIKDKYWPASVFHISNVVNDESILEFCRKELEAKSRLVEYVKGVIGGKTKIYPRRKVEGLRAILKGMDDDNESVEASSCEGESSKKRKDGMVLGRSEEPLSKKRLPCEKMI